MSNGDAGHHHAFSDTQLQVEDSQDLSQSPHDHSTDQDAERERSHFQSVLASFEAYLPYSLASNNLRRRSYYALTRSQRALLSSLGGKLLRPLLDDEELQESSSMNSSGERGDRSGLKGRLDEIDDRIRRNASFLDEIVKEARDFIGETDQEAAGESSNSSKKRKDSPGHSTELAAESEHSHNHGHSHTSSSSPSPHIQDVDKVRSTLKQFARDWSSLGAEERAHAYDPILQALDRLFISTPLSERHSLRLLFPGCGLGRLPWEAAMRGFSSQGNEFSFFMLLASHFVLNKTTRVQEHVIYPWVHTMSNWRTSDDLLQAVRIPDVDPNALTHLAEAEAPQGASQHPPDFSMVAGDFLSVYSSSAEKAAWSAVCTAFFLDTARNPISYLETISHVLPIGGYWINLGPLLWHFEGTGPDGSNSLNPPTSTSTSRTNGLSGTANGPNGSVPPVSNSPPPSAPREGSIELTLEEVLDLIEKLGFTIQERRTLPRQSYTGHANSMLTYEYQCEFWVARKVREVQRTGFGVTG
ncbi:N2227-domain-containing protein [Microstroma glucosiphilum]|uniref:carnosine N-methyltransferase n=1 Tax=Pseudomicrostroma glucosiphilum TaxID=1684307 RepID=A0A316U1N7_9BASI|nr:N2227-domain-containing protein [Pseudomicrostroma glucosiphilum]PWN19279.1 N2227-domain-containing protein [Pseudomicrostroma glucosiphilum]